MTFIEQFEVIKKKTAKLDPSSLPHDLAMQVNLTDDDCCGAFYIANIDGNFAVEPYDYRDHTVMLTLTSKVFLDVITGKLDATDAIFRGLVDIQGNIDHAQAVADIAPKKAPRKATSKTAEKKPAAKKTTTKTATKTAEKKPAAKKTATKKTTTKKTTKKVSEEK